MKKFLIAAVMASASLTALAGGIAAGVTTITADTAYPVCDATVAGTGKTNVMGGPGVVVSAPVAFTRAGFAIQCSNNVHMSINEVSANLAVVGSASAKGNQYFGGHTNGGSVTALQKCATDPCGTADVTSAITAAKTAASS
ncbi:MAG TPA: hypothetical protein PK372_05585 [Rugosibacter sp.]|nr:hypothetical protein [Rugosibacter sp.]HQN47507.1 hypothetical protein [Rugosibacter sp.]HQQ35383.1 hypothetical protein [Rugosibacter sp.]